MESVQQKNTSVEGIDSDFSDCRQKLAKVDIEIDRLRQEVEQLQIENGKLQTMLKMEPKKIQTPTLNNKNMNEEKEVCKDKKGKKKCEKLKKKNNGKGCKKQSTKKNCKKTCGMCDDGKSFSNTIFHIMIEHPKNICCLTFQFV